MSKITPVVHIHEWTSNIVNYLVPQQSPLIQLAIINIEMVRDSVFSDHATKCSGIEGKK